MINFVHNFRLGDLVIHLLVNHSWGVRNFITSLFVPTTLLYDLTEVNTDSHFNTTVVKHERLPIPADSVYNYEIPLFHKFPL